MTGDITLNQFDKKNATPSKWFAAMTKVRIIVGYPFLKFGHWYHKLPKTIQVTALSSSTIALFLLVLIAYPTISPMIKLTYYRVTGKGDAIFQNYYNTRTQNALAADGLYTTQTAEASYDMRATIGSFAPNYYPFSQDSSDITVIKTKTKTGPGISICPEYNTYYSQFSGEQLNEHAYYQNLYKSVLTTAQGELIEFFLTNQDGSYEYRGGSYAILHELPKETVLSNPEPEAITDDQTTSSPGYIGSDDSTTVSDVVIEDPVSSPDTSYNLVAIEKIDGKDYLVYEYTYEQYCHSNGNTSSEPIPSIQKTWVDPDTYITVKDVFYYQRVSDSTLVYETTTTVEYLDPSLHDTYFAFDIAAEVRTIPYTTDSEIFAKWLPTATAHALIPTDENVWFISGISSPEAYNSFYTDLSSYTTDRSFYAPGAIGDYYFSLLNASSDGRLDRMASDDAFGAEILTSKLDVNAYQEASGLSLYTAMFSGIISETTFQSQYGLLEGYVKEQTTLVINGVSVNATKYIANFDVIYETNPSDQSTELLPTGYNATMPDRGIYGNYYYVAVFEGNTYYITLSGESTALEQLRPSALSFTILSTQNPQDRERIQTLNMSNQVSPAPMPLIEPAK